MYKKEAVVYVMRQISYRRKNPTRGDKQLLLLLAFATGCWAAFAFAFMVSGSDIFAQLYYIAIAAIIIVFSIGFIRWMYDIIKSMK
jgi:hypothetical protein